MTWNNTHTNFNATSEESRADSVTEEAESVTSADGNAGEAESAESADSSTEEAAADEAATDYVSSSDEGS